MPGELKQRLLDVAVKRARLRELRTLARSPFLALDLSYDSFDSLLSVPSLLGSFFLLLYRTRIFAFALCLLVA